jgi:hypothetical protein
MKTEHKHAAVLRAIADEQEVQWRNHESEDWRDVGPSVVVNPISMWHLFWRIKPRTILINGLEVPEPMRVEPDVGTVCWLADMAGMEAGAFEWDGDEGDLEWLNLGLVHATEEAAQIHADALLSFTRVKE